MTTSATLARPLVGLTAIVTGGASGIGLAISERLAADGAKVAIFDLDAEAGDRAANGIVGAGGEAIACRVDVADRASVEQGVADVRAHFGPVKVLVNNAGIDCIVPFMETDIDLWNRVYSVNITGAFHCTQVVLPDMLEAQWGRIVNVSSSSAQRGSRNMVAYSSSKGAMIVFTRSLALELAPQGITVNNVPPGFIETPMLHRSIDTGRFPPDFLAKGTADTPVGRPGQPEDIANAVSFLASPAASYVTGQTLGVNGGRVPT